MELGEGGPLANTDVYAKARRTLKNGSNPINERALKSAAGYGCTRAKNYAESKAQHPFFGLTIVSSEKGDMHQSPNGLFVYVEEDQREINLPKDETGRDALISELYDAVLHDRPPVHDGRWAKANLEV